MEWALAMARESSLARLKEEGSAMVHAGFDLRPSINTSLTHSATKCGLRLCCWASEESSLLPGL